jgi:WD40 repeat protein
MADHAKDYNLLFGVFALQLRKIDANGLAEFAAAWAADPSRSLSERLVEAGILKVVDCDLIDNLINQAVQENHGDLGATVADVVGISDEDFELKETILAISNDAATRPSVGRGIRDLSELIKSTGVEESQGRYMWQSEHAKGGMGKVYIVHDSYLGRDIALKELLPHIMEGIEQEQLSPDASVTAHSMAARFIQEARISGKLEHPSIVPVYEMGRRNDGTLYYTMKYVKGRSLAEAINDAKTMRDRLRLLPHYLDLCHAIAYAHSCGVIHRDIKPDNVMIGEFGETVVIDWGISKIKRKTDDSEGRTPVSFGHLKHDGSDLTTTVYGDTMGTPKYMSPEQALGELDDIDERSDVYALGIVLYEILTSKTPFEDGSVMTVMGRIVNETPDPVTNQNPEIPPELSAIVDRAIAKKRLNRYQSAKELAEEIQRYQSGALVGAYRYHYYEIVRKFVRRNVPILATGAAAVLALVVFGVYSYVSIYRAEQEAITAKVATERALDDAEDGLYYASIQLAAHRLSEGNEGLARAALNQSPKHLRNWEWGYLLKRAYPERFLGTIVEPPAFDDQKTAAENWNGSTGQLEWSLDGHQAEVNSIAFGPRGSRIITAAGDSTARIWDSKTGKQVLLLGKEGDLVQSANFSEDGTRIVTSSTYTSTVEIWDATIGEQLVSLDGHTLPINQARFDRARSRVLTVSSDNTAKIWDAASGAEIRTLVGHAGMVMDGYFTGDGKRVLTASIDGTLRQWDVETGEFEEIGRWEGNEEITTVQMCSTSQSALFGFRDGTSGLLKTEPNGQLLLEGGRVGKMDYAGFSNDESAVIAPQKDRGAIIFDADTGKVIAHIGREQGRLLSAVFSPDGSRVITGGTDGTVKIWMPGHIPTPGLLRGHEDIVYRGGFSPDGQYAITSSFDGTAIVWDAVTNAIAAQLSGHDSELISAFYSPDGSIIQTSTQTEKKLWNAGTFNEIEVEFTGPQTGQPLRTGGIRTEYTLVIQALIKNPIGPLSVLTSGGNGTQAFLWKMSTGQLVGEYGDKDSVTTLLALSPDTKKIVTSYNSGELIVWDVATAEELVRARNHKGNVSSLEFSADGLRVLSSSTDRTARIWNAETGKDEVEFVGHSSLIVMSRFSPDETLVVTASGDGTAKIWDALSGEELHTLAGLVGSVINAVFSPDGSRILTMSLETASLWDLQGRELATWTADADGLFTHVSWSPDGRHILACYRDGKAMIWDSVSWNELENRGTETDTLDDLVSRWAEK